MEYLLLSDKELLEYCANDDLKAFNVLFDRYSGKVYCYKRPDRNVRTPTSLLE